MPTEDPGKRLDSWKEIAEYMGRDVRTVVRWEKERGLPVRRVPGGRRQAVFALTGELDAWSLRYKERGQGAMLADDDGDAGETAPASPAVPWRSAKGVLVAGSLALAVILGWLVYAEIRPTGRAPSTDVPRTIRWRTPARSLEFVRADVDAGMPHPYRFAAADLNGDHVLDLVFTSNPGDVIGVLLGKGDGTFLPARLYGGCPGAESLVVADLNRDTIPDVAATCMAANVVVAL